MSLRIPIDNDKFATVISAYAPTLNADDDIKETFYASHGGVLASTSADDKLVLLGDFNARVGRDCDWWRGAIGREGVGNMNSNGLLLLSKCIEHDLVITNTLFRQRNSRKTSWQHPRSKHWHLLDYVIVRRRDRRDVVLTRTTPGSEYCWTDHRLVLSKMKYRLFPKRRTANESGRTKFNVGLLEDQTKRAELQAIINRNLGVNLQDAHSLAVEEHWQKLKMSVVDACKETIGMERYKQHDWFDENDSYINELLMETRNSLPAYLDNPNSDAKKRKHREKKAEVQRRVRKMTGG